MEDQEEPKTPDLGKLEKQESSKTPNINKESQNTAGSSSGSPSLYNLKDREENPATEGTEKVGEEQSRFSLTSFKQKFQGRGKSSSAKKWFFALGGGGGLGLILLIIAIFLLLNSTKLIQVASHIEASRLARISSDYTESDDEILDQTIAVDTASDTIFTKLSAKFSTVSDSWGSMWDKINTFRPDKVVDKLETEGDLEFTYTSKNILGTNLTRNVLSGVKIAGEDFPYSKPSAWSKIVSPIQNYQDAVDLSKGINTALSTAMEGRSVIIRGAVASEIRDRLGIKLSWWNPASYRGKSAQAAEEQAESDSEAAVNAAINPAASEVGAIGSSETAAETELQDCEASCLAGVVASGGALPSNILTTLANALSSDAVEKVVGFINPLYAAAVPACLIFDGSYQSSGTETQINNTNAQLQRTGYEVTTAADQEKEGNTNGEAVGAMNWKVGDISSSVPELMSAGSTVDTSTTSISPQTPANGSYDNTTSVFNTFLPGSVAGVAGQIVNWACSKLTNFGVALGLGVLNLAITVLSGFTAGAAEKTISQTLVDKLGAIAAKVLTKRELVTLGVKTGATAGASLLLNLFVQNLVGQKSGVVNAGLATSTVFDDSADAGMDLNEQSLEQGYYGRPLTYAETAGANQEAQDYTTQLADNQSLYQRYFAVSNVSSLVSRLATAAEVHLNLSAIDSLMQIPGKLFNGSIVSTIFGDLTPKASANSPTDTSDYGIVQWGWSPAEDILKGEPDYLPLENQEALTNAAPINGQTAAQYISQTYGFCWTDNMGQLLTSDNPSGSPAIVRAATGDIDYDQGQCSPQNLGPDNPTLGDLVFRYRLEMNYEETMDQLQSIQSPTSS